MECDFDRGVLDRIVEETDAGDDLPPPVAPPPRERRVPPDPGAELWHVTWLALGAVALLGVLKLALFAVGGAAGAIALGSAFVAVHGLLIAAGASWFWPRRYAR